MIDPLERWRDHGEKPDYAGLLTFSGMPYTQDAAELAGVDVAIVGAPTDDLVSDRPGTRFGPRAIRAASCPPGPHLEAGVDGFSVLRVVDFGDAPVLPADPIRILRDAARPVLDELAETLRDIAVALRRRDADLAEAALVRARGTDEFGERFFAATREGRSATRLSRGVGRPGGGRGHVGRRARALVQQCGGGRRGRHHERLQPLRRREARPDARASDRRQRPRRRTSFALGRCGSGRGAGFEDACRSRG